MWFLDVIIIKKRGDYMISFEECNNLLLLHTTEPYLILHAKTVSEVMGCFAKEAGEDVEYWKKVGLLHDIDFEKHPDQHCKVAPQILGENGFDESFIRSVVSHAYGICSDVEPTLYMEKVLFAIDELTGIIHAARLMRPSKSCKDMELKSLKKKYKDKKFAAGCSRDVIARGAEMLGIELDILLQKTLDAMGECEDRILS